MELLHLGLHHNVVGGLRDCKKNNIPTACITCNKNSPLSEHSDHKIEVIVGPEFVTGSSRLKAGTSQKLILNMISTISMILLGHVRGNKNGWYATNLILN